MAKPKTPQSCIDPASAFHRPSTACGGRPGRIWAEHAAVADCPCHPSRHTRHAPHHSHRGSLSAVARKTRHRAPIEPEAQRPVLGGDICPCR